MTEVQVSQMDVEHLQIIRNNVVAFLKYVSKKYAGRAGRLLDIAPQVHEGARPFFSLEISIDTLDIDPNSRCTYIGDICQYNARIRDESYDYAVCTEVLEHTLQPFDAVDEIWRMMKPNGFVFITTPFNFRIHGPLPDCWRFTEHGLRALLKPFQILELKCIETLQRALMPVHYTVIAQKVCS